MSSKVPVNDHASKFALAKDTCISAYIELALAAIRASRMLWPARPKFHVTGMIQVLFFSIRICSK